MKALFLTKNNFIFFVVTFVSICIISLLIYSSPTSAENNGSRDIFSKKISLKSKNQAVRLTLNLKSGNSFKEVNLNHTFHTGDEFQFNVYPKHDAFIYVLNINPKGKIQYVWPPKDELETTNNRISGQRNNLIMPNVLFEFGLNTGDDWLLLVISHEQKAPKLDVIKYDFNDLKIKSGNAFEYKKTSMFGMRSVSYEPSSNDLGAYAGVSSSGDITLVYPYLLKHIK